MTEAGADLSLGTAREPDAPQSERELLARAERWSGRSLADLAREFGVPVPVDLRRAKGWVGGLLERALGAKAGSRAVPDFENLGIELKTIPVDARGRPLESTFVCTIELSSIADSEWQSSRVFSKLRRVLWIPVEGSRPIAVGQRQVGAPLLWSPTPDDEAILRADWEELAGLVARGETSSISGHLGVALQVRPKAANASSRRLALDEDGAAYAELPRGFYLRANFTGSILARHFALPRVD